jgi:hypothetical protein
MIQRIQSVWLFLAAMVNGLLFISKLYHYTQGTTVVDLGVRDSGHIALFIVAAIITILPLVAIFFFGDRKRQKGFVWLSIIFTVGFLALAVMKVADVSNSLPAASVQYDFGLLIPILSIILMFLAVKGINKDEKLIKSLDRLR